MVVCWVLSEEVNPFKSAEEFLLFCLKMKTNSPFFTVFNQKRSKSLHRPQSYSGERSSHIGPLTL